VTATADMPALMALASNPPEFSPAEARRTARELYGVDAEADPKPSERDRNFRINDGAGADFVLKVCNAEEDPAIIDFQIAGLSHVASVDPTSPVPRVVATLAGDPRVHVTSAAGEDLIVFALTYCPGKTLHDVEPTDDLMRHMGIAVAKLDVALESFVHGAPDQALVWDIRQAQAMRQHVPLIADPDGRRLASAALDRFAAETLPAYGRQRHQVIHNDINRGNVLVIPGEPQPVSGIIDFGDMVHGPLVLEISTAAMELAAPAEDPVGLTAAFLEGYVQVTALSADEVDCVYDGLMTRLAVGTAVYAWRHAYKAEPRFDAASVAARFVGEMKRMEAIGRETAAARFHAACGTG
jgi:Ser/Thr protein kinase RdoA (MazF antagonist)